MIIYACTKENIENKAIENSEKTFLLFNKIPLIKGENGKFIFKDERLKNKSLVEELFTQKNQLLTKVHDFGLGVDEVGGQYFFVKEITDEKTQSIFIPIEKEIEATSRARIGGGSGVGTLCENKKCCDDCIYHSTLKCTCHDISSSCIRKGKKGECKKKNVAFSY